MPAPRGRHPGAGDELEAPLGRSLAETERLNRPAHRAGENARAAVRRQMSLGARRRRGFGLAVLVLLALIALLGLLVRNVSG